MGTTVKNRRIFHISIFAVVLLCPPLKSGAATFFVDCGSGSDSAAGTTAATAWKSIDKVSATEFAPGDTILFRRGTHCVGSLSPKGSGRESQPIRIGAYGSGPLPVLEAGRADAALSLSNQQFWEIANIETTGGSLYGIHIAASGEGLHFHHFRLQT
jgi:hypothetical protein